MRLQPKNRDLRLQIASLEDQSGNPERVVALLEEALPYDANGRIRSALAQAYLREGQAVKGMRELRLLAGTTGFDPRSAESAAAALTGYHNYYEQFSKGVRDILRLVTKNQVAYKSDSLVKDAIAAAKR